MGRILPLLLLLTCVADGGPRASAQVRLPTPVSRVQGVAAVPQVDSTVGGALRTLASRAGVVFVGQVASIERKGGVVEITFRVHQVVQGQAGATYALREWGGLWSAGQQRYALGQRAMMFLHAPNAAGLSSPVDGMEGVVPVVPMGANAAPLLDVRRLAARVQRAVGQPMSGEAIALADAVTSLKASRAEPPLQVLPVGVRPVPVQMPGYFHTAGELHDAR